MITYTNNSNIDSLASVTDVPCPLLNSLSFASFVSIETKLLRSERFLEFPLFERKL